MIIALLTTYKHHKSIHQNKLILTTFMSLAGSINVTLINRSLKVFGED